MGSSRSNSNSSPPGVRGLTDQDLLGRAEDLVALFLDLVGVAIVEERLEIVYRLWLFGFSSFIVVD